MGLEAEYKKADGHVLSHQFLIIIRPSTSPSSINKPRRMANITRITHDAFNREVPLDQDKLSRLVVKGLADIPQKLLDFGIIDADAKGPVVSTMMRISPDGDVIDSFLHIWSKKSTVKFPATVLFPQAPAQARIAFRSFEFQAFDFTPSKYMSNWVKSRDLNTQLMKSNNRDDGFYDISEWAALGVRDFVIRVNVVPRDDVGEADVRLVALPVPYEDMSVLPGDTRADGYPCVAVLDKVAILAVPNMEPVRKDGLPLLPMPVSNTEVPPIPDSTQILRAMYSFWSKPRVVVSASIATWTELVRGPASPNVGPVLASPAWPELVEQQSTDSESEEEGEYMFLLHLVNSK